MTVDTHTFNHYFSVVSIPLATQFSFFYINLELAQEDKLFPTVYFVDYYFDWFLFGASIE